MPKQLSYYQQPIAELNVPGFSPFFGLLLAIWQLRPLDLQKKYPLNSLQGRIGFLAWCVVHGRKEYQALRELSIFWETIAQPADIMATPYSPTITRLMQLVALSRTDAQIDYQLASEVAQINLLRWFCLHGWAELNLSVADLIPHQKRVFETKLSNGFTFLEVFIYAVRLDLHNLYDLNNSAGQMGFKAWLTQHGCKETILGLLQLTDDKLPTVKQTPQQDWGVNLIGYAFGELGIGEDVRMAALALEKAKIPFTVVNFRPGDDIRQNDRSIEQWVSQEAIYPINIVCLTALEHLRLYTEQGESLFKDHYTIGYWPWELQNWPLNWQQCFNLVDEVWASSQHIFKAIEKVTSVPVYLMPMAVAMPKVIRYQRIQWSLPINTYLFVFSFDGKSSLARKNPLGVVEAFAMAFPKGDEAVGLVIKCMRPDSKNRTWQSILKRAKNDSRIHIIDQMLSKPEVLGLYKLCDCFVSLHRAEGFGRGIAEALLLGLKVIATNHGGNIDFCLPGSAYLVNFKPIKVRKRDYIEATGQYWAEPDITIAASYMQQLALTGITAKKAVKSSVKKQFSLDKIGENYKNRLTVINNDLKTSIAKTY